MNDAKKSDITQIVSMTQFELRMKLDDARLAQKAIDDVESAKELLYVVNKTAERVKKEMIEKAKDAFNETCGWLAVYPWYNGVFEEFVKEIEE